jgi:two-component system chemotaxis response regulator CheY
VLITLEGVTEMSIEDLKVLICDDSILARKQIKDIISADGIPTFYEASDGQGAIDMYKEYKPDIVFLDIVMPKKDGNIAIEEIMSFDPDATIIICSSVGTQSLLKCALEAGAKDFVQKPIDPQQVLDIVNKFLEGR